jgi:hypothetical protein
MDPIDLVITFLFSHGNRSPWIFVALDGLGLA